VDNVLKEKIKIGKALVENGFLLLPGDNPYILSLPHEKQFVYYGLNPSNDLRATHLEYRTNGIHFDVDFPGEKITDLSLSAFGDHMVLNSLPVLFLARKYGIPIHTLREVLTGFTAPAGRGRFIQYKEGFCIIDETYNANPVSFRAALKAFANTPFPRKILVFSDMLELGEGSATLHKMLAHEIASYAFDTILYYGDHNNIMEPILKKPEGHYYYFPSMEAMEQLFLQRIQPGDGVLMKASNGKHLSEIVRRLESKAC
jgi:UDP-N-acetylmuramoyl-tripeptide--D-alanyl-D-alanine ligase